MAVWRCPHCATPQAESARCWVCHRSTTSCATCRHFVRAVAGGLGLCGLDPRRAALTGTEMRSCWRAPEPVPDTEAEARRARVAASFADTGGRRPRTFVPVDELVPATDAPRRTRAASRRSGDAPATGTADGAAAPTGAGGVARAGWSLWGDLEP